MVFIHKVVGLLAVNHKDYAAWHSGERAFVGPFEDFASAVGIHAHQFHALSRPFFSSEVVGESFSKEINGKYISVVVVIVGTIAAILYPMDNIEEFLYLINSVFAPMIAVMIADFFFNKKRRVVEEWDWANLVVWLIGLILYRVLMHVDIVIGYTLPDIVITAILCMIVHRILPQNHLDKAL